MIHIYIWGGGGEILAIFFNSNNLFHLTVPKKNKNKIMSKERIYTKNIKGINLKFRKIVNLDLLLRWRQCRWSVYKVKFVSVDEHYMICKIFSVGATFLCLYYIFYIHIYVYMCV